MPEIGFAENMRTTFALACILLASPTMADWTIQLPAPAETGAVRFAQNGATSSRDGALILTTRRAIWIAPTGRIIFDTVIPNRGIEIVNCRLINERQCVLACYSIAPEPFGRYLCLLTVTGLGTFSLAEYGPFAAWSVLPDQRPDHAGAYSLDLAAWTLTRVEFPKPSGNLLGSLQLQSSTNVTGPWSVFQEFEVPANTKAKFFRLEPKAH